MLRSVSTALNTFLKSVKQKSEDDQRKAGQVSLQSGVYKKVGM